MVLSWPFAKVNNFKAYLENQQKPRKSLQKLRSWSILPKKDLESIPSLKNLRSKSEVTLLDDTIFKGRKKGRSILDLIKKFEVCKYYLSIDLPYN
jgi:hypothetical protein